MDTNRGVGITWSAAESRWPLADGGFLSGKMPAGRGGTPAAGGYVGRDCWIAGKEGEGYKCSNA